MNLYIESAVVEDGQLIAIARRPDSPTWQRTLRIPVTGRETPEDLRRLVIARVRGLVSAHRGAAGLAGAVIEIAEPGPVSLRVRGARVTGTARPSDRVILRVRTPERAERDVVTGPNKLGVIDVHLAPGYSAVSYVVVSPDGVEGPAQLFGGVP